MQEFTITLQLQTNSAERQFSKTEVASSLLERITLAGQDTSVKVYVDSISEKTQEPKNRPPVSLETAGHLSHSF